MTAQNGVNTALTRPGRVSLGRLHMGGFPHMGEQVQGGHSCYEGGHRAHGGPPVPPLGKTLHGMAVFGRSAVVSPAFKKKFYKELQTPFLIENNNKNNRKNNRKLDPVFKNELKTGLYCRMSKRI